ncbi:MAG: hypothetical protein M3Z07_04875 [Candidatus Eremiobacteraeota bacterium]|nr:hypothetical protein [Candidatus Eremiobacteraeota bacterium]
MSAFEKFIAKFISKMDEGDFAAAIAQTEGSMTPVARAALVEAILDAFRERGESSEDAAEGAGTTAEAIAARSPEAVAALLRYAQQSPGLLKEAVIALIELRPEHLSEFSAGLGEGLSAPQYQR